MASGNASAFATGDARQVRWCFSGNAVTTRKTVRNPGKACHAARTSSAGVSVEGGKAPETGSVATKTAPFGADAREGRGVGPHPRDDGGCPDREAASKRGGCPRGARTRARRCVSRFLRASRANARRLAAVSKKFHREKKKKKAFLRLFFTFSNGVCSLRFDRRGVEKQMSVENVLELSNGAPLSRQFARAFAEPATTRARSPRVARVARPRAFVAFPAR